MLVALVFEDLLSKPVRAIRTEKATLVGFLPSASTVKSTDVRLLEEGYRNAGHNYGLGGFPCECAIDMVEPDR